MMRLVVLSAVVAVAFGAYNGDPKLAAILRLEQDTSPDGTFQWAYDTENGITAQAAGQPKQVSNDQIAEVVQGAFQWTAPEGDKIEINYIADENGYQPQGSALPTPPPIPEAIAKSLEYIRTHAPAANAPGAYRP